MGMVEAVGSRRDVENEMKIWMLWGGKAGKRGRFIGLYKDTVLAQRDAMLALIELEVIPEESLQGKVVYLEGTSKEGTLYRYTITEETVKERPRK